MTTNKPEVKRYDCTSEDSYRCHGCFTMKEQLRGDYVEWEVYEALQAECEKLVEALQDISRNELDAQRAQHVADVALAAHRKQGGDA